MSGSLDRSSVSLTILRALRSTRVSMSEPPVVRRTAQKRPRRRGASNRMPPSALRGRGGCPDGGVRIRPSPAPAPCDSGVEPRGRQNKACRRPSLGETTDRELDQPVLQCNRAGDPTSPSVAKRDQPVRLYCRYVEVRLV